MTKDEICRLQQPNLVKLIDEGKLVEVVHCKDCRDWNVFRGLCDCKNGICRDSYVGKDDFCSYGRRWEADKC